MNDMMRQVQKMQADMAKAQDELKNESVEASAGGGMVTVKVSGELEVLEVRIDPEGVDPEDVELLQDMVQAATNEALRSAQELAAIKMGAVTGGLGGLGPAGALDNRQRPLVRPPDQPPDHRAGAPARASASAPLSGWRSTSCAPPTRRRSRWPTPSARSRRRSASARSASTSPPRPRAGSARTSAATAT